MPKDEKDFETAAWLLEQWPVWFAQERFGARTLVRAARDFPLAVQIAQTWPDRVYLERLARLFLSSTSEHVRNMPQRTIGQFAYHAPAIDAQLRGAA